MKPTMTRLWHNEMKNGDEVRVELRIDWSNNRHHAQIVEGAATPENVAIALQKMALMIDADMAERT